MISEKTLGTLEFDKILADISQYAVLNRTKNSLMNISPLTDFDQVKISLNKTLEAYNLLYKYNVGGIYYFDDISDELDRATKGGTLNNLELLRVASNLKSARILRVAISTISAEEIVYLQEIASRLYYNQDFEKEITSKILSEDEISDNASPKLYSIRKNIKNLSAKIRERLNSYVHGSLNKYLQDAVVTIRQDRYVIPVKSEYRSFIKGFIHDQSSSGATVFIEPEPVMELNNDLKKALLDEKEEIFAILAELSKGVAVIAENLKFNAENIQEIDECYAKAQYSFVNKCSIPDINDKGIINIKNGRHPLISKEKVVPVSISFGKSNNFLLVTGPNTGGKTVTLKLVGLLTLMTMCGVFIPASDQSEISIFNNVFCDIGDEQSIENELSTFSSHIKNLISILNQTTSKSLILIDEIGAGTDPEEGSALALAIIEKLLSLNCFGIITTHYSKLKEFAMQNNQIENASMEFDSSTLKPLYKLNIGIPGSSNAIDIARTLGLDSDVISKAFEYLSDDKISFENVLKKAEDSRRVSELLNEELEQIKHDKQEELQTISLEREKIAKERERIYANAKVETKRIVSDKLSEAEEIIDELKKILKKSDLANKDIFKASELKNRLKNSKHLSPENTNQPIELIPVNANSLQVNDKVYVKSLDAFGILVSIKNNKKECEVLIGAIKSVVKISDLYNNEKVKQENKKVKINRNTFSKEFSNEINVIGQDSIEALENVKNFLDKAVVNNLEEVKIIHGVGAGILLKEIRNYLKTLKTVKEFRRGQYGEGENGVTIVTLK